MHLNSITSWEIGRYPVVKWMAAPFCLTASREEIGLSKGDSTPILGVPCVQNLSLVFMHLVHPVQMCPVALITLICIIC